MDTPCHDLLSGRLAGYLKGKRLRESKMTCVLFCSNFFSEDSLFGEREIENEWLREGREINGERISKGRSGERLFLGLQHPSFAEDTETQKGLERVPVGSL